MAEMRPSADDAAYHTLWSRTNEYRYIRRRRTATDGDILQQAWRCLEDGTVRWERVPVVLVDDTEYDDAARVATGGKE